MAEPDENEEQIEEYDDEGCRDFLVQELGQEIPRFYRYPEGMHEVRKRIILRYGDKHYAKAMDIFKELLEKDDNASGLGDDGDDWRSWRHEYGLRGMDLANLGTPRFPGMILPATTKKSTTPHIPLDVPYPPPDRPVFTKMLDKNGRIKRILTSTSSPLPESSRQSDDRWPLNTIATENLERSAQPFPVPNLAQQGYTEPHHAKGKKGLRKMIPRNISGLFTKGKKPEEENTLSSSSAAKDSSSLRVQKSASGHGQAENSPTLPAIGLDGACDEPSLDHSRLAQSLPDLCFDGACDERVLDRNGLTSNLPCLCFDGACDERDSNHNSISIDEHDSIDLNHSSTLSQFTQTRARAFSAPSHSPHRSLQLRVPAARLSVVSTSCFSTATTAGSIPLGPNKTRFRALLQSLLNTSQSRMSATIMGNFAPLDPIKYCPPPGTERTSEEMSEAYSRYASMAAANPFMNDRSPRWPSGVDDRGRLLTYTPYLSPGKPTGMVQSQSEGQLAYLENPSVYGTRYEDSAIHLSPREQSPVRGRNRSPVRVSFLDDLEEDVFVDDPTTPPKRSRSPVKKMFGENGWLGRSTSMKELPAERYRKTGLKHWGGKLKQRVEGLTEDVTRLMPNPFNRDLSHLKDIKQSKFPISLDPPTQSKMYGEVELMICVTANTYLMQERREGRMSVESLLKVTEFWKSKNRPQVVEFQFDQGTQRDLIVYNIKTFRFYGKSAENVVDINTMLYSWKTLAKEMAVRTFCSADSVIRKQLQDVYKILELLGAPLSTFLAFQEVQVTALKTMREEQRRRDELERIQYGVERVWNPPASASGVDLTVSCTNTLTVEHEYEDYP